MTNSYWGAKRLPYKPGQKEPYKISRSKIDFFMECARCFWLDQRLGIKRPHTPPFLINSAVDALLKREFDFYRQKGEQHPWQVQFKITAKPFAHDELNKWRANFTGVQYLHPTTNLLITGAVDDVWITPEDELVVVDYKATAKSKEIKDLEDSIWHDAYRRQMEVYQWLLRHNGFKVSNTGYFVYANGIADKDGFFNKVEFRTEIFPYTGSDKWIEPKLVQLKNCLEQDELPNPSERCEYCGYIKQQAQALKSYSKQSSKKVAVRAEGK